MSCQFVVPPPLSLNKLTGAESVRCDIQDIVSTGHDMNVAIGIYHSSVSSVKVFAIETFQVSIIKSFCVLPKCGEALRAIFSEFIALYFGEARLP